MPTPAPAISRRHLLAGFGGLLALPALAACAGGSAPAAPSGAGPAAPTAGNLQLGWLPNVESMAVLVAQQRGYYAAENLQLTLAPGGPNVVIEPQIVSGNALVGIQSSDKLADTVSQGADLIAIGAMYQSSSSCVLSRAERPVREPRDLEGLRFGISQSDTRVYGAFFRITGVNPDAVTLVQVGADPAALASGEVDAMSAVLANQPVALRQQGIDVVELKLADHGYNRWSGLLVTRRDTLEDEAGRAAVTGVLRGTVRGMQDAVADPAAAAQAVVDEYGQQVGLQLPAQAEGAAVWASLARTDDTTAHGLVRVTPEGIESQQRFLDAIGVGVRAADIFDTSVGDAVFGDGNHV